MQAKMTIAHAKAKTRRGSGLVQCIIVALVGCRSTSFDGAREGLSLLCCTKVYAIATNGSNGLLTEQARDRPRPAPVRSGPVASCQNFTSRAWMWLAVRGPMGDAGAPL